MKKKSVWKITCIMKIIYDHQQQQQQKYKEPSD